MSPRIFTTLVIVATVFVPTPSRAGELFAGLLVHDVHLPIDKGGFEHGAELEIGYRSRGMAALRFLGTPSLYVRGALATAGETDFISAGLSWRIGRGRFYFRPAAGIAIQTGHMPVINSAGRRVDLGSRVVFEPEVALGFRITRSVALEAALVHRSHAELFNRRQNPGMDSLGLRLTFNLP